MAIIPISCILSERKQICLILNVSKLEIKGIQKNISMRFEAVTGGP